MSSPKVSLRLPAGLLRIWHPGLGGDGEGGWSAVARKLEERLVNVPGVHRLGMGFYAALPQPGDGDVLDAAAACGRKFLRELERRGGADRSGTFEVRMLVHPGWVEQRGETVSLVPDDLTRLLDEKPPPVAAGAVHLTARAALALETPWEVAPAPAIPGPSERVIPIFRLGDGEGSRAPWHNREIWNRRVEWLSRPGVEERFAEHTRAGVLRVTGPLGCGKTRTVLHVRSGGFPVVHVGIATSRMEVGSTAGRLLRRCATLLSGVHKALAGNLESLARELDTSPLDGGNLGLLTDALHRITGGIGPWTVVLDNLQRAVADDWRVAGAVLAASREDPSLRAVLVGRNGAPWPEAPQGLVALPQVEVPPLEPDAGVELVARLLPGVNLPETAQERLLRAAAGNPFVLEEGVVRLIQRRSIRRFYGAFVFSGSEEAAFEPSVRLAAHLEAEGRRLGATLPLRLLAVAGEPIPARELASAASLVGGEAEASWELPFLDAGWLRHTDSAWGAGVELTSEALATVWRGSLGDETRQTLRRTLGELLSVLGGGEGLWRSYRLLSGDPEAIPLLLETAGKKKSAGERGVSEDELVDALRTELKYHRDRGGTPETELRLLWRLMPTARRTGRLTEFADDLDRALELAEGEPRRVVALSLLKAELDHGEGRFREAEKTLRNALAHTEAIAEPQKALLLVQLGHLLMRQKRNEEAVALFRRILPMLEVGGLRSLAATCHFHLGNIALAENRLDDALEEHRLALEERRHAGTPKAVSASVAGLGAVHLARGQYPQALEHYQEAEKLARESGDEAEIAFALRGVGRALTRLGDFTAAAQPLRRCLEIREHGEDVMGEAVARLEVAENYLLLNNPGEALRAARKAAFRLNLLGGSAAQGDVERLLGRIQAQRRRPDEARKHFLAALDHHTREDAPVAAAFTRGSLIRIELDQERRSELIPLVRDLATFLERSHYPELGERLDLQLYRALTWLDEPVEGTREPMFYLRRSYKSLMDKTAHLAPGMRHRFLFQIPDHEEIVAAATKAGISVS
jgi:tetratricopeptide (TPR) repeat protein